MAYSSTQSKLPRPRAAFVLYKMCTLVAKCSQCTWIQTLVWPQGIGTEWTWSWVVSGNLRSLPKTNHISVQFHRADYWPTRYLASMVLIPDNKSSTAMDALATIRCVVLFRLPMTAFGQLYDLYNSYSSWTMSKHCALQHYYFCWLYSVNK